jgi:GMP synthase-like glutamine amidotransferase
MADPWVVLQHVSFEGPGLIASAIQRVGGQVETRRMDRGEPVPRADEIGGLVVMGGPMGALDDTAHPNLCAERELLRSCVEGEVPVVAVCLGAQLLAAALGARVFRGAAPEVGLGIVTLTDEGRRDPVFGPAGRTLPVFHWHGDTFDLPPGATLLASSDAYTHQAFRVGNAYAIQFHGELAAEHMADVEPHLPPGVSISRRHLALVTRAGTQLLDRLIATLTRGGATRG